MDPKQMEQLMQGIGKLIDDKLNAYDDKRKSEEEEAKKKAEEEAKKKAEDDDALKKAEEEVKKRNAQKTQEELQKERFLDAFKYNSTIKEFLKNNRDYLPENLEDIINILDAKVYKDDLEKAQELKRAVVEQYIKKQENLDMLPDSLKAKAEKYAGFTTKEKLDRALDFYDIVETGIHTAKNIKKVEALQKSGDGAQTDDAVQNYENKMLEFSKSVVKGSDNNSGNGSGDGK